MAGLKKSAAGVVNLVNKAASKFGIDTDQAFTQSLPASTRETIQAVAPYTMTSLRRVAALCDAVEYIHTHPIEGDIVECGVWKGGSSMAIARTLAALGSTEREIYMYDTYEGMSAPTEFDTDALSGASAGDLLDKSSKDSTVWAYSPFDEVKQNMARTGYDQAKIHMVRGTVEETIPGVIPDKIALLRLDTDWYESTRHELIHLFPRLAVGGILIIDDYGHWEGAKKAVDEYFAEHGSILLTRIDYTGRIAVKSGA